MFHIAGGIVLAYIFIAALPLLLRGLAGLVKVVLILAFVYWMTCHVLPQPQKPYYQQDDYIKAYATGR